MPFWVKRTLQVIAGLLILIILLFISLGIYVSGHRKTILTSITAQLNKNLNGSLTVADMETSFFNGFPGVSLSLKNVEVRDSLWAIHHHSLLKARVLHVSVNTMALLKGTVEIRKIGISDASVYLFTDSAGYSNTSVFKKKPQKEKTAKAPDAPAEIRNFELKDVRFILDNRKGNKLFLFGIQDLSGKADFPAEGWAIQLHLKTMVRSLAFNTRRGSFVKDKMLEGRMDIAYHEQQQKISIKPNVLTIGDDPFTIGAEFTTGEGPSLFTIKVVNDHILWKNAAALLSPNITAKLNKFNLKEPIAVDATIGGDLAAGGDPSILVHAAVHNNSLNIPGAAIEQCSFNGVFTNHFIPAKGFNDANSSIQLYKFSGTYKNVPFKVDSNFIQNLEHPVSTGIIRSDFDLPKLNELLGEASIQFTRGTAGLKMRYTADVVNFNLVKPLLDGKVQIKNADVSYVPRNMNFKNTSISLNFTGNNLLIRDLKLQSGKSSIAMEGSIRNFLNLYYDAPEKIMLNWEMTSPQINLAEFVAFLGVRKGSSTGKAGTAGMTGKINDMLEKGRAQIRLRVNKVFYKHFTGTDGRADILLSDEGLRLNNISLKHAGGSVRLNGLVSPSGKTNRFSVRTQVSGVSIRDFFYAFDNFGLQSLTYKNLQGLFSTNANISGSISSEGTLIPRSMHGDVNFTIQKGALLNFESLQRVGKFAFPFRDLNTITFQNLKGNFDLKGEKVQISPMLINSSILNMNVEGVYSMGKGTNIFLDVPLRNPKKDQDITDKQEIRDRRMRGIVLHILATDGDDGKIKFKLLRKREQADRAE